MRPDKPTLLVVERESDAARSMVEFLGAHDFEIVWVHSGESALNALDELRIDCVVSELRAPHIDGVTVLRRARERNPEVCAVLLTDGADLDLAQEAMRRGAYDFQLRPVLLEKLLAVLQRGLHDQRRAARLLEVQGRLDERLGLERLAGRSRGMQRAIEQVRHIGPTRSTVLIEGEPGTGKRLIAQAIHQNSARRGERFVWVNCDALAPELIEIELFGDGRVGVSGAAAGRRARLELADGGTLYLDDVGEVPPAVQVKLLRLIQERCFERYGGTEPIRADVRLIAGTRRNLVADVRAGRFRDDLFVRLGLARIEVPPLRARPEDLPLLVNAFIREFNRAHGRRVTGITRGALERLLRHSWPNNVRELRGTIEGMVVFAEGRRRLGLADLPDALRQSGGDPGRLEISVGMTVAEAERHLIEETLRQTGHDKPRAAALLGIGLRTLYRRIKDYGIG